MHTDLTYAHKLANAIRADLARYMDSPADFTAAFMEPVLTAAEELQDTIERMLKETKQ
jgi:hypothetical protein